MWIDLRRLTRAQFIEKAKAVHGDKYDYFQVEYVNSRTAVMIICSMHGAFWQTPRSHLNGCGCPDCACESQRFTTSQFIEKARDIHGDSYDYSRVAYVNMNTKVTIVCPEHGPFEQGPYFHLRGQGCPICAHSKRAVARRFTTEQFIEKARDIHGNKYDYSQVVYVNSCSKVKIICPKHGLFEQVASAHLNGGGCPECFYDSCRHTTEQFIERAKAIHGDKYDYSQVVYVNNHTKVKIICPRHGMFEQIPSSHLEGCGCFKCAQDSQRCTNAEFVEKAKAVHGDKYDYSRVEYVNCITGIMILCPRHGLFEQSPLLHLQGHGCPRCGKGAVSQSEDNMYQELCSVFGDDDVERQYYSQLYPFACDFYVKSRDLYIELNGYWTHNDHWFDCGDLSDLVELSCWKSKQDESTSYIKAVHTWTVSDVKKRQMAADNKLNYAVFWDSDLTDFHQWVEDGCPDRQDWAVSFRKDSVA